MFSYLSHHLQTYMELKDLGAQQRFGTDSMQLLIGSGSASEPVFALPEATIIIGTPNRLLEVQAQYAAQVRYVVIDEIDALLDPLQVHAPQRLINFRRLHPRPIATLLDAVFFQGAGRSKVPKPIAARPIQLVGLSASMSRLVKSDLFKHGWSRTAITVNAIKAPDFSVDRLLRGTNGRWRPCDEQSAAKGTTEVSDLPTPENTGNSLPLASPVSVSPPVTYAAAVPGTISHTYALCKEDDTLLPSLISLLYLLPVMSAMVIVPGTVRIADVIAMLSENRVPARAIVEHVRQIGLTKQSPFEMLKPNLLSDAASVDTMLFRRQELQSFLAAGVTGRPAVVVASADAIRGLDMRGVTHAFLVGFGNTTDHISYQVNAIMYINVYIYIYKYI